MDRGFRLGAAILATGALLATAGSALAAIAGTYNGAGKGFTISFHVSKGRVQNLNVGCGRGAVTVEAIGAAPRVKQSAFTYSGSARSTNRKKSIYMKVTGTFTQRGKKVHGTEFTAGACKKGKYWAGK